MYQMRKTWVEVKANITACIDAHEVTWLAVDDWHNKATDMTNSDGKAEIDPTNMELAEFSIHTKMSLANSIRETRRK